MTEDYDIKAMAEKVRSLRQNATELMDFSGGIPAVDRNVARLLACVRMLEIDICDITELE